MRRLFIVGIALMLSICSCTLLSNSTKVGDTKIFVRGNEIVATNFPSPTIGVRGVGKVDWGNFSFEKFDEYIYKQAKKSSYNELYIVVQRTGKDEYGNKKAGDEITIGRINVAESKKYADFYHWNKKYKSYDMWMKDYDEYKRKYLEVNDLYDTSVRIIPGYKPHSIR